MLFNTTNETARPCRILSVCRSSTCLAPSFQSDNLSVVSAMSLSVYSTFYVRNQPLKALPFCKSPVSTPSSVLCDKVWMKWCSRDLLLSTPCTCWAVAHCRMLNRLVLPKLSDCWLACGYYSGFLWLAAAIRLWYTDFTALKFCCLKGAHTHN